jgi:hypothetical protein
MSSLPSQRKLLPIAATITKISFTLFLILSLTTPSWRGGPFRWWPLWHFPLLAGAPVAIGPFNLLPLFIALGWFVTRWWRGAKRPVWQWGITGLTLPLLGFTILGLLSLEPDLTRRTFTQGGGLALF